MKIRIYQINTERDKNLVCFFGLEDIAKFQGTNKVNSALYDSVYFGTVDCKNLEDVYYKFNVEHPKGYKARSLSVSDVVEVIESDKVQSGFYYCDSIGFKRIDFDPKKTQQSERFFSDKPQSKISVLLVEPGKYPSVTEMESDYKSIQNILGAVNTEDYEPYDDGAIIIFNRDGIEQKLDLNRAIRDDNGKVKAVIAGKFIVAYSPPGAEEIEALPENLIEKYREIFKYPEKFRFSNDGIEAVPFNPKAKEYER